MTRKQLQCVYNMNLIYMLLHNNVTVNSETHRIYEPTHAEHIKTSRQTKETG